MRAFLCLALLGVSLCATAQPVFDSAEIRAIAALGPWPPAPRRDPSNRVSGKLEAVVLGERLFYEPRLSGTGSVLCATCHVPYRGWQDGRAKGFGLESSERNTPTLLNVSFQRSFGWDGGHDTLWSQSIRPLLDAREMRSSARLVGDFVRSNFASGYERAFDRKPPADDAELLADVGKALAAFQETLVSGRTPFDDYRDSLLGKSSVVSYPDNATRGLKLFLGQCNGCHAGPLFTNGELVAGFRVPGLRNVAKTAPYMHDGSVPALALAARHGIGGGKPSLTDAEVADLVRFLESLSEKPAAGGK